MIGKVLRRAFWLLVVGSVLFAIGRVAFTNPDGVIGWAKQEAASINSWFEKETSKVPWDKMSTPSKGLIPDPTVAPTDTSTAATAG